MEVKTRKLTVMAMLTAVSVILVWLIHLPLILPPRIWNTTPRISRS